MAEEGEPQLRGIDLLMSVEKKQKDELRQKRKSQKRTISASSSVGKDEQTAEDVEVVEVAAKDSEETQLEEIIFGGDHAWDQLQQEDDLISKSHLGKTANKVSRRRGRRRRTICSSQFTQFVHILGMAFSDGLFYGYVHFRRRKSPSMNLQKRILKMKPVEKEIALRKLLKRNPRGKMKMMNFCSAGRRQSI